MLIMSCPFFVLAQENGSTQYERSNIQEHELNESRWERIVSELDYSKEKKEKPKEEEVNNTSNSEPRDFNWDGSLFSGNWSGFFKVFFFILVIGLLAYITLRLMGNSVFLSNKRVDRNNLDYSIEKVEADIHQSDLEGFARHALDKQDYKLAIRLYFLQILKELSVSKLIKWKRDKTNNEYIREMRSHEFFKDFRHLTRQFERVWYGDVNVQEKEFNVLRPQFLDFLKKIN